MGTGEKVLSIYLPTYLSIRPSTHLSVEGKYFPMSLEGNQVQ